LKNKRRPGKEKGMKIEEVKIQVIDNMEALKAAFSNAGQGGSARTAQIPVITIITDDGTTGISFGIDGIRQAHTIASLRPLLLNQDPFYVERIWQEMWAKCGQGSFFPEFVLATVDMAIWDIIGKAAQLPLYKILGAYRDKVPTYASVMPTGQWQIEDFVRNVLECKSRGFTAYKIHARGTAQEHIAICRAVREAAGEDMVLMHDPGGQYSRHEALLVGRELEKLNYYWLEDPVPNMDVDGLAQLARTLDIPVAALESLPGNLYSRARYITHGAVNMVRGDVLLSGGITPLKKIAALAEAFGMDFEIHVGMNPLAKAAVLHVICSISNCTYFEWLVPDRPFYGVKKGIKLDDEGYAHVPQEPGLGLEIDQEYLDSHTITTL